MNQLTIAIATCDRPLTLVDTIAAFFRNYPDFQGEVLVVDQTPESEIPEGVSGILGELEKTRNFRRLHSERANLPAARNRALRESKGDLVLFIDDDVLIPSGYLEEMVAPFSKESIGGVAGQVYHRLPGIRPDSLLVDSARVGTVAHFPEDLAATEDWGQIMVGCNHCVRRLAALETGGYDENIKGGYYEDSDFTYRLRHAGWKIGYSPGAWLLHLKVPSGGCRIVHNLRFSERDKLIGYTIFAFRHLRHAARVCLLAEAVRAGPLRRENLRCSRIFRSWVGFAQAVVDGWKLRTWVEGAAGPIQFPTKERNSPRESQKQ